MEWIFRDDIKSQTWESIEKNEYVYLNPDWTYTCDCKPHPTYPHKLFSLCKYHQGFDDAISDKLNSEIKTELSEIENNVQYAPYIIVHKSTCHWDIMQKTTDYRNFSYYFKIAESDTQSKAEKILNSLIHTNLFP